MATLDSTVETASSLSIASLYNYKCIPTFTKLSTVLKDLKEELGPKADLPLIIDELGRLRAWAGHSGAHRHETSKLSLDYRLREAPHVHSRISGLLVKLHDDVHDAINTLVKSSGSGSLGGQPLDIWDDSSDDTDTSETGSTVSVLAIGSSETRVMEDWPGELHEIAEPKAPSIEEQKIKNSPPRNSRFDYLIRSITRIISCLYEISITIQDPAARDRLHKFKDIDIKDLDSFEVLRARETFPRAAPFLVERLARANLRRRRMLEYYRRHPPKIKGSRIDADGRQKRGPEEEAALDASQEVSASRLRLTSCNTLFADEMDEIPEPPAPSVVAINSNTTISSYVEAFREQSHNDDPLLTPEAHDHEYSQSSFGNSSASCSGITRLCLPPPPRDLNGTAFPCPYCFDVIHPKDSLSWLTHLVHDLQPYVCTYEDCAKPDRLFSTCHDWYDHETQVHRRHWFCMECSTVFVAPGLLKQHILHTHQRLALPIDLIIQGCEISIPTEQGCPLCGDGAYLPLALRDHLAQHMREFAFLALPEAQIDEEADETRNSQLGEASCAQWDDLENGSYMEQPGSDVGGEAPPSKNLNYDISVTGLSGLTTGADEEINYDLDSTMKFEALNANVTGGTGSRDTRSATWISMSPEALTAGYRGIENAGFVLHSFSLAISFIRGHIYSIPENPEPRWALVQHLDQVAAELSVEERQYRNSLLDLLTEWVDAPTIERMINNLNYHEWEDQRFRSRLKRPADLDAKLEHWLFFAEELKNTLWTIQHELQRPPIGQQSETGALAAWLTFYCTKKMITIRELNKYLNQLTNGEIELSIVGFCSSLTPITGPLTTYHKQIQHQAKLLYRTLSEGLSSPVCECGKSHSTFLELKMRHTPPTHVLSTSLAHVHGPNQFFTFNVNFMWQRNGHKFTQGHTWELQLEPLMISCDDRNSPDSHLNVESLPEDLRSIRPLEESPSLSGDHAVRHPFRLKSLSPEQTPKRSSYPKLDLNKLIDTPSLISKKRINKESPATTPTWVKKKKTNAGAKESSEDDEAGNIANLPTITRLCAAVYETIQYIPIFNPNMPPKCLGLLKSTQGQGYRVWIPQSRPKPVRLVSLADLITTFTNTNIPSREDRLVLGLKLLSSVLQLNTTQWLSERWEAKDILFPKPREEYRSNILSRPFVHLAASQHSQEKPGNTAKAISGCRQSLYSLGIVLLEIWHWQTFSSMHSSSAIKLPEMLFAYELSDRLLTVWSKEQYGIAVQRCIRGFDMTEDDLDNDSFRKRVYLDILEPLKNDLEMVSGRKISEIIREE